MNATIAAATATAARVADSLPLPIYTASRLQNEDRAPRCSALDNNGLAHPTLSALYPRLMKATNLDAIYLRALLSVLHITPKKVSLTNRLVATSLCPTITSTHHALRNVAYHGVLWARMINRWNEGDVSKRVIRSISICRGDLLNSDGGLWRCTLTVLGTNFRFTTSELVWVHWSLLTVIAPPSYIRLRLLRLRRRLLHSAIHLQRRLQYASSISVPPGISGF
ncbi:hypothetical protein DL93DRAFT_2172206 [Clavulina sp. PMI_390]|nr:hypothetical protein DL93DRAFT_2172206 [Clavulina sp. PMI_390]